MAISTFSNGLTLDRFAAIVGYNPVHFNGGYGASVFPSTGCAGVWTQYPWQNTAGVVSRSEIAAEIAVTEREFANIVGWNISPRYEQKLAPVQANGIVDLNVRKLVSIGSRVATFIDTPTIVYSDSDGDSFDETATISVAVSDSDLDYRPFFPSKNGAPEWQITPYTASVSGGILTMTLPSWVCVDPILWEKHPGYDGVAPLDMDDDDTYIDELDIYSVATVAPTSFSIVSGSATTTVNTATIISSDYGIVQLQNVDNQSGCATSAAGWVTLPYLAGNNDLSCENSLSHLLATAVAHCVIARLARHSCGCSNAQELWDEMKRDTAGRGTASIMGFSMRDNPLGTRVGEVDAWRKLQMVQ